MTRYRSRVVISLVALCGITTITSAQTSTFVPGSRDVFVMDFAKAPLGDTPKELRVLRGKAQVVEKDGAHMLRAAEPMEFMINLKENLPEAFTLEFDLIPKACCNPEDISFEGTPSQSRSQSSSNVVWQPSTVIVAGGGEYFQTPMPQDLSEILPSAPTKIGVSFDASGMKLYTHDRLIATLSGRKFAHGRVLRVFLGGQDDDLHAVYLGRLRIGAGGAPSGPVANNGPTPQVSNNTTGTASTGTTTTLAPSNPAVTPLPGLTVTVVLGALGPVVSWPPVADATGYSVTRQKIDDVACCNSSSGRTYITAATWQDQPPPVSGTYNYLVLANTPAGFLRGEARLAYQTPAASAATTTTPTTTAPTTTTATTTPPATTTTTTPTTVNAVLATTTGTATPIPATATGVPTTGTTVLSAPVGTISPTIVSPTSSNTGGAASDPNGGTGAPNDVARYRVTLTGFRVMKGTLEPPGAIDGRYDEAYAAASVILWDRKTLSVRLRSDVRTREYGDIDNGTSFGTRIKAGTASPSGGLWTTNGADQVPAEFDPAGATIPAPTTDRFPLVVWEGPLTAGVEALLVVPTVWDRDMDPSPYALWKQAWSGSPVGSFFANPLITSQMIDPRLSVANPQIDVGGPFVFAPQDALAHIKDRPIGMWADPFVAGYRDRHVMITREKIASLAAGAFTTLAIPLTEAITPVTGANYTLYLRIDRIQ